MNTRKLQARLTELNRRYDYHFNRLCCIPMVTTPEEVPALWRLTLAYLNRLTLARSAVAARLHIEGAYSLLRQEESILWELEEGDDEELVERLRFVRITIGHVPLKYLEAAGRMMDTRYSQDTMDRLHWQMLVKRGLIWAFAA